MRLPGDVFAHAVVDAAAGEDHLWVIADHLRLVGQVIGIDADAVPADEPRPERQEIPFRAGGLQHFLRVDAEAVEDHRQLVHQRDVEIALRVLDHLGRLRDPDLDARCMPAVDHGAVERGHLLKRLRVVAGHHFDDVVSVCSVSPGLMRSGE